MTEPERTMDSATIDSAAAAIKRYLQDHPDSADTVDGVAEFWLTRQRVRETRVVVSEALKRLTASGAVHEVRNVDGRVIYKLVSEDPDG